MSGTHIAALFETVAAAKAAEASLIQAGVDAGSILVLDRGHHEAPHRRGIWNTLKHVFVPDDDAHDYAEAIVRGHPLLVADVTDSQQTAALTALQAAHPIDIEQRTQTWRDEGWSGEYDAGPDVIVDDDFEGAEGSEGELRSADLLTGDYGSVGAPLGAGIDLNILRGKTIGGGGRTSVRTDEGGRVRIYSVE